MAFSKRLLCPTLLLALLAPATLPGCSPGGSDNDGGGDTGGTGGADAWSRAFGSFLADFLSSDSETFEDFDGGWLEPREGNPMIHGTCETKPSEAQYDIREAFALDMVPTSKLRLDHELLTNCGPVGDAFVFCPPGGMPTFGDYVVLTGFALGGDPGLSVPDTRTQIGITFKADGGTPWQPLPQYMCDSWANMTSFFNVNAQTDAGGTTSGYADYSMPDGQGGIMSVPTDGIVVWQNGMVLGVLDADSMPLDYSGVRFNFDRGPAGNFDFMLWGGGDAEPDANPGRVDDSCFQILTY